MAIQNAPGATVQTQTFTPLNPASYMPTQPYPLDMSLIQSPVGLLLKGMSQGMDMGEKIAGMPNAMEKLKTAKALTENARAAMDDTDKPSSKAYSIDASGASQFRGKDAPMMPDVLLGRAQEQAQIDEARARAGLTGAQTGLTNVNAGRVAAETNLLPLDKATKGQEMFGVDAYGRPVPGMPNATGGTTPAAPAPGVPNASTTAAPTTATGGGPAPAQGTGTVNVPVPTAKPGESLFTPDQVKSWWGANWSDTAKNAQWSAHFNNGQGAWVVTHQDGSKDVVTDDLIQKNTGKWTADIPLDSSLKMSAAQRQAGQLPSAPVMGSETPLMVDAQGNTTPASVPGPAPANAMPTAAPGTVPAGGGAPQAMPAAPGAAPGPGPAAPPLPQTQAQSANPTPPAPPQAQGWKDPNAADFGDRKLISMQGNRPVLQPAVGAPYVLESVAQDGTEIRRRLDASEPYKEVPMTSLIRQKQLTDRLGLEQDLRKRAQDEGMADVASATPQQMSDFLNMRQRQKNALPEPEVRTLNDMADAMELGEKVKKQAAAMKPSQYGAYAQWLQARKDQAQGLPIAGELLGPPDQGLAEFNGNVEALKSKITAGMNHSRINGEVGKKALSMIGSPADNPGTLVTRVEQALDMLRPEFVRGVMGEVSMGKGVPDTLLKKAAAVQQFQDSKVQGGGATPSPTPGASAGGDAPRIYSQKEYDALKPGDPYYGLKKGTTDVWVKTTKQ